MEPERFWCSELSSFKYTHLLPGEIKSPVKHPQLEQEGALDNDKTEYEECLKGT